MMGPRLRRDDRVESGDDRVNNGNDRVDNGDDNERGH